MGTENLVVDEEHAADLERLTELGQKDDIDWSGEYFGKGQSMDFGMSCEELTDDKNQFSQFTEEFFRKVGLDNVLSRGENFSEQELLNVTKKIINNIEEAKEDVIDKTLTD